MKLTGKHGLLRVFRPKTYLYVLSTSGRLLLFKIGIGTINRPAQVDKSIRRTKERIVLRFQYYLAPEYEKMFRRMFSMERRFYKGSGYTEWHRLNPILFACLVLQMVFLKLFEFIIEFLIMVLMLTFLFRLQWELVIVIFALSKAPALVMKNDRTYQIMVLLILITLVVKWFF